MLGTRKQYISFILTLSLTIYKSYQLTCPNGQYLDHGFEQCKSCQNICDPKADGTVSSDCKSNCQEHAANNTKCQEDYAYVAKKEKCIECSQICKDGTLSKLCKDKCKNFKLGGCRYNFHYDIARETCVHCEKYCTSEKRCTEGCEEYLLCHSPNPCRNAGICTEIFEEKSYNCACAKGWKGKNCDEDVLECESNPCSHGGECLEKTNGFECKCGQFYSGDSCESLTELSIALISLFVIICLIVILILLFYKKKIFCFRLTVQEENNGNHMPEDQPMLEAQPNGIIPTNLANVEGATQSALADNGINTNNSDSGLNNSRPNANGRRRIPSSRSESDIPPITPSNVDNGSDRVHYPASYGGSDSSNPNQLDQRGTNGATGSCPEFHPLSGGTAKPIGEEIDGTGVEESSQQQPRQPTDETGLKEFVVA